MGRRRECAKGREHASAGLIGSFSLLRAAGGGAARVHEKRPSHGKTLGGRWLDPPGGRRSRLIWGDSSLLRGGGNSLPQPGPRSRGAASHARHPAPAANSTQAWKRHLCPLWGDKATRVDHFVPLSEGGSDEQENLRDLCSSCHEEVTLVSNQAGGDLRLDPVASYFCEETRQALVLENQPRAWCEIFADPRRGGAEVTCDVIRCRRSILYGKAGKIRCTVL